MSKSHLDFPGGKSERLKIALVVGGGLFVGIGVLVLLLGDSGGLFDPPSIKPLSVSEFNDDTPVEGAENEFVEALGFPPLIEESSTHDSDVQRVNPTLPDAIKSRGRNGEEG